MILDDKIVDGFKKYYNKVHPIVFNRSLDKAENPVQLFEILEDIPKVPFTWNENKKKWTKVKDFMFFKKVDSVL